LAAYPDKYIFEPWMAPLAIQQKSGCVIGIDYPERIVNHDVVSKENMAKMKDAYGGDSSATATDGQDSAAASGAASSASAVAADFSKKKSAKKSSSDIPAAGGKRKAGESKSEADIASFFPAKKHK